MTKVQQTCSSKYLLPSEEETRAGAEAHHLTFGDGTSTNQLLQARCKGESRRAY